MEILPDAKSVHECLKALIRKATLIEVAVAWASVGFDAFDLLLQHKSKIHRFVVGIHFHQTHPDFIQAFHDLKTVKFVMSADGTFHPKAYFFELPGGKWSCVVGSPNFTYSAMNNNEEMGILVGSDDLGSDQFKKRMLTAFDYWWKQGRRLDSSEIKFYRLQWQINRTRLNRAAGVFIKKIGNRLRSDGGAAAIDIPIIKMDWNEFFGRVKSERREDSPLSLETRLSVIEEIRDQFQKYGHFKEMPKDARYKVAGLGSHGGIDFGWFGSMKGAGVFKGAVNSNSIHLSEALDWIPLQGEITRDDYLTYVEGFQKAFPGGRHGVATATRLLAMKRPDVFVCLDSKNKKALCKSFKIPQSIEYDSYWDSIVERIRVSSWWNADRPTQDLEQRVWDSRAAFLDALFYEK